MLLPTGTEGQPEELIKAAAVVMWNPERRNNTLKVLAGFKEKDIRARKHIFDRLNMPVKWSRSSLDEN